MDGWPDADSLLGSLRTWYETTREEAQQQAYSDEADHAWRPTAAPQFSLSPAAPAPEIGLLKLAEEFTALRQEVKLQTKASRGVQQQAEALLAGLEQTLARIEPPESAPPEVADAELLPWVETLADLDDALWRAESELAQYGPRMIETLAGQLKTAVTDAHQRLPGWRRWLARRLVRIEPASADDLGRALAPWLQSWADGYRLLRSRLRRHLERHGLERIDCVGQPLDPHFMTAVQIVSDSPQLAGTVLAEVRGGYVWNGQVVRFAEVSVAGGNT